MATEGSIKAKMDVLRAAIDDQEAALIAEAQKGQADTVTQDLGWAADDIAEVIYDERCIQNRVKELGAQIAKDYQGLRPVMVGVLNGAAPFLTDLVRAMQCDLEVDFIHVSSYGAGTSSSGNVRMIKDMAVNPAGRHIILVEDIVDTGLTMKVVGDMLLARQALSVKICTFLDKKARREHSIEVPVQYIGYHCPNKFVVGYGCDFAEKYRNLPYLGVLRPHIYEEPEQAKPMEQSVSVEALNALHSPVP